jgi:rhodanese-related sulfurtransferase
MKTIFQIALITFISFGMLSCKDAGNKTETSDEFVQELPPEVIIVLTSEEFAKGINAVGDIQLVDVRTPEEVAEGTIAGAINFDFRADGFEEKLDVLDKSKPVYVFCRSGGRSANAASIMKEMGFTRIYDLDGGITAWKAEGKEVVE